MAEYITKEQVIDWFRPYGHMDEPIPFETMVSDLRGMPAVDVAPVRHGQWDGEGDGYADGEIVIDVWYCSECGYCIDDGADDPNILPNYCPNCGAKMDGADHEP